MAIALPLASEAQENNETVIHNEKERTANLVSVQKPNSINAKTKLMSLLKGISFFTADFSQKVVDEEANVIQHGSGSISVSKPNLVRWQTNEPGESLIVSDEQTLWVFDPFIEQASAYNVNASIANTPILLLGSDDESLWDRYNVSQVNELMYLIHSIDINSRVKTLALNFTRQLDSRNNSDSENHQIKNLQISSFSLLDSTGQLSDFKLSNINMTNKPEASQFIFNLPEGADLDDQR